MGAARFDGKAVLVTGAASGIGRATALRIASEGGLVILADRNLEGAKTVAALAREQDAPAATALAFDAADPTSCRRMVRDAIALNGRLDCVINNAGIYRRGHFLEKGGSDWDAIVAINLTSFYHIIHEALPALIESRGNVVNTASTAGLQGIAYAAPYAAAKAGVIALTKSLATEFAPKGVRFNAICPGRVKTGIGTDLTPLHDVDEAILVRQPKLLGKTAGGEAEDIAGAFAYLASDDAAYTTGAVLVIDGAQNVG